MTTPHLQLGKPRHEALKDQIAQRLGKNPPDIQAVSDKMDLIMEQQHEILLLLKARQS